MHPVILRIGPITIYSYGLMLALAFVIAILVALPESKKRGVANQTIFDIALISAIAGIVGARLWYAAFEWRQFISNPLELIQIQKGGLAVQGGLIMAFAANAIYCRVKGLRFWELADILAPSVILGQAIGRIGCFLNGCCFGVPTRSAIGVIFPPDSPAYFKYGAVALHPTELYQLTANLLIFALLIFLQKKTNWLAEGSIFLLYVALYSIGRFAVETFRADSYIVAWGLSNAQVFSLFLILVSITVFLIKNGSFQADNVDGPVSRS